MNALQAEIAESILKKVGQRILPDLSEFETIFSDSFSRYRNELLKMADETRRKHVGDDVFLRGLIEFSNYCSCACNYCGISSYNRKLKRFRMTADEILNTVKYAYEIGFRSFVLQAGEDKFFDENTLLSIIDRIKSGFDCALSLSTGEWPAESLRKFKNAGADRYLLRIETSDPVIFGELHPDSRWEDRDHCLKDIKNAGFQTGSGILIGIPGQSHAVLYSDLKYLIDLDPEMIGIGPFIPHPDTPLGNEKGGDIETTITFLALIRLYLPDSYIPATTAMGSIHPEGRKMALMAGANVLMPNVSPVENRASYELYPNKICLNDNALKCTKCIEGWVGEIGRKVNMGYGHIVRNSSSGRDKSRPYG
ncbi:MAG: [FeFe] hydrogenase H-cluster radical SAM maturase HydE [Candidatus Riflebacteria bacterium]|nr:[FeFe] hydrogenase H-cluster radical SAM maturase HydE [Candidatus Riflebacteria bacterium]